MHNAYLLLGPDTPEKQGRLESIKKEFLSDKFKDFNTDKFFADELNPQALSESLVRLPVKNTKRLIIIRNIEKFSAKNREIILSFLKKPRTFIVLVLETSLGLASDKKRLDEKHQFLQSLKNLCNTYDTTRPLVNTFGLARLIDARRSSQALVILAKLFEQGERPERILGGLRFHWSKERLAPDERKTRLKFLLEADKSIKTSSLKDNLALELMVVKLCRL